MTKKPKTTKSHTTTATKKTAIVQLLYLFLTVDVIIVIFQYAYFYVLYYVPLMKQPLSKETMARAREKMNHVTTPGMHTIAMLIAIGSSVFALLVVMGTCGLGAISKKCAVCLSFVFNAAINLFCLGLFAITVFTIHKEESKEGDKSGEKDLIPGYVFYPLYIVYVCAKWYFGCQGFSE